MSKLHHAPDPIAISYKGNGRLVICLSSNRWYADAHGIFQTFTVTQGIDGWAHIEWIPGFKNLRIKFRYIQDAINHGKHIDIQYPDWTCDDYEQWLKDNPS